MSISKYSFESAIQDGTLLDVSEVASKVGLPYPTYMSSALWRGEFIERMDCRVLLTVEGLGDFVRGWVERGEFGKFHVGIRPDLESRRWPAAACPSYVPLTATVTPSDRFGLVVIATDQEEELDFRVSRTASGSFFPM